ncbi:MAG TPA: hypothetical protein VKA51_06825 [Rubrobacteraceae bacterium]|nr:hypothetical protein [Rubrobacteraceae bacterium]
MACKLAVAAVYRSPFLQLAGVSLGVLCALAGLVVSLTQAF